MDIRQKNVDFNSKGKIHYSYILAAVIAFLLGVDSVLIIRNYFAGEVISLSTLDIINLIFSVGLSTASIVLAIVAIVLAKKSEQIILTRNDESIKYQREVFDKTIKVLSKIETSTGVSEKRLEDVFHQIKSIQRGKPGSESEEDKIKDVLRRSFGPGYDSSHAHRVSDETVRQREFNESVEHYIKQIDGVKLDTYGGGDFSGLGEEMVDMVFSLNGRKFSVSTFYSHGLKKIIDFTNVDTYQKYFLRLAFELKKDTFNKSFLVFNKKVEEDKEFIKLFNETLSVFNKSVSDRMVLVSGSLEDIRDGILREIK